MKAKQLILLSITILLFGCATYPQTREKQAAYHANEARAAIAKDEGAKAVYQIAVALSRPTGDARIRELFTNYPKGRNFYRTYLEKGISEVSSAYQAAAVLEKLSTAKSAGIFPEDQLTDLFARLGKAVADGNVSGSIPFDLGDNQINLFPVLKSPSQQQIIVERSIKNLQSGGSRPIKGLTEYIQKVGTQSAEGRRIESLLTTMNIRRDELETVTIVFPNFAATRKEELTTRVFLQIKGGDRLLMDDLLETFRSRVRGVEWVSAPGPKTTTLTIERVRHDERTLPERSQTITYAQSEVNLLAAALLMPRNASYLYEVISGGAEIEYGYVVTAAVEGKTFHDEVIRGKLEGEYRRCQNARIQNVFGGVSSAGFVANDDMQQRCSGPSSASIDGLRNDEISKLVEGVLRVQPIKVVHELN